MIRIPRLAAALAAFAITALVLPAQAQNYSNAFTPAKLIHRADTSVPIAGSGTVVIQVEVHADGSHQVTRILRSTNPNDNPAAIDIAKNSTYRPQHRGKTPVTGFYDFTIKFTGKSVASRSSGSAATSSGGSGIDTLIHSGKYSDAKARAQQGLASRPNDPILNQQLGTADYFLKDYTGAAAAFDKVPSISKAYMQVAAQSFALAAESSVAQNDPTAAISYAQKAVTLAPSGGTYYALGAAQLSSGDVTSAITNLSKARSAAFSDPKTDVNSKVNIDAALLNAYLKANDSANAQRIQTEIGQLDPGNSTVKRMVGNALLTTGNTDSKAGKHQDAIDVFLQAAKQGDTQVAVTGYASAALEENTILNAGKTPAQPNDYLTKMKPYADQALALNPNDPLANYALGVAMTGAWITGGKNNAQYKTQALDALNKAQSEAQTQGNISLALNIANFIKTNIPK